MDDRKEAQLDRGGGTPFPAAAALVLPFVVALAVGMPAVNGTFIRDDWDYVSGNPHVVCRATLRDIFKSPFQPLETLGLFRPVTTLSLRLDALLGGEERPWIFHLTNLILAGLAASCTALVARNLTQRSLGPDAAARAALVAGLLFATHPARTEAVCWVSGRAENLMTLFALLTLVLATGPEKLWRTILAFVCALLAAWSKEQAFALALLVPIAAPPTSGKRLVTALGVAVALALAFTLRFNVMHRTSLLPGLAVFEDLDGGARAAQGFRLLLEYARVTVWPHPLRFEYDQGELRAAAGFADPRVLGGLGIAVLLVATALLGRFRPVFRTGAALFFLPLLPVLHWFLPIGEDFAERFLALPLAGIALLLGALAARFRLAGFGLSMLVVTACGAAFAVRAPAYLSERALYEDLLAKAPASPSAKSLFASTLMLPDGGTRQPSAEDRARADGLLRDAVAADPNHAPARVTLAALDGERRRRLGLRPLPAEMDLLIDTARRFPLLTQVHGMLGVAWADAGMPQAAEPELAKELAIMPYDVNAALTLALILEERNEAKRAEKLVTDLRDRWEKLWRRFPGFAPVAVTYARTLSEGGRDVDGARATLRAAVKAACRPRDKAAIAQALAAIGG